MKNSLFENEMIFFCCSVVQFTNNRVVIARYHTHFTDDTNDVYVKGANGEMYEEVINA